MKNTIQIRQYGFVCSGQNKQTASDVCIWMFFMTVCTVEQNNKDIRSHRQNQVNYTYTGCTTSLTNRGLTGYGLSQACIGKHLDWVQLTNMFSEYLGFGSVSEPKPLVELIPKAIEMSASGNGRVYDPVLGRFLSPDNYVQMPDFSQNFNRYTYVLNNPLKFTDPDGEIFWFIPVAIGAAFGGFSGYQIGKAAGAESWNMAGYIFGGGLIGGLSGGAVAGISAAGGGAMLAGAGAGAVGGAGFSGLATGWDADAMTKGAVFGGLSGLVGGGIGASIGGGWGALAGGASANLTVQLLYNGGDFNSVNWGMVAGSGALSLGMYHGMTYASWKWGGGSRLFEHEISYKQYAAMNRDFQRSRFWQKEYGGYLLDNGSVQRFPASSRHNYGIVPTPVPENAFASYHNHWAKPGQDILINPLTADRATAIDIITGNVEIQTTMRYHSPSDIRFDSYAGIRSYVINRYDFAYNGMGSGVYHDRFLRFFLFPFWKP